MKLSVIIPCYNEKETLESLVVDVVSAERCGLDIEVIIVDDASSDGSAEVAGQIAKNMHFVKVYTHEVNLGKGAALRTGFQHAQGDIVLIQDADREYSPKEYPRLLAPILDGFADVVYGSRFLGGGTVRVLYFWHSMGNRFLTLVSNVFSNLTLTDMETCYKVFRREVLRKLVIEENRFGFEPEITIKLSRLRPLPRIYETSISYQGRTYEEGKKITWKDGVRALYCILRYRLFPYKTP